MDKYSNSIQGIRENYNAAKSNKSLKQKLFTAYLNEHLICNSNFENKPLQKEAINTFDNTDLFYLLKKKFRFLNFSQIYVNFVFLLPISEIIIIKSIYQSNRGTT